MKTKKSMIMIAVIILVLILVSIGLVVKKSSATKKLAEQEFIPLDKYEEVVREEIKKNLEENK